MKDGLIFCKRKNLVKLRKYYETSGKRDPSLSPFGYNFIIDSGLFLSFIKLDRR